jgi:hypothetical protein
MQHARLSSQPPSRPDDHHLRATGTVGASAVPVAIPAGITPRPPPHTQVPLTCRRCGAVDIPTITPGTGQRIDHLLSQRKGA